MESTLSFLRNSQDHVVSLVNYAELRHFAEALLMATLDELSMLRRCYETFTLLIKNEDVAIAYEDKQEFIAVNACELDLLYDVAITERCYVFRYVDLLRLFPTVTVPVDDYVVD